MKTCLFMNELMNMHDLDSKVESIYEVISNYEIDSTNDYDMGTSHYS